MPVPGPHTDPYFIGPLIVVAAALCVRFWRTAVRLVIIVITALAVYGAIQFMYGLHHAR
jgi:hypothetical protein